jgi:hypothetical protein
MNETYRLKSSILGIQNNNGRECAVTIPADTVLTVHGNVSQADGLVECDWDGTKVSLFARDIRERGIQVGDLARSAG